MNRALIIFAKEPVADTVKTRLKNCFSNADLIRLYKAFVKDTLAIAREVEGVKRILAFSSIGDPRFLRSISRRLELIGQKGRTLGERMLNAFVYARDNGAKRTVIIGTDSPTLPVGIIEKAFGALSRHNVALGPSVDGGYYLIGMKKPRPEIFKGVRWSSASVLKRTLANAKASSASTALLDEWYDVDDREGLMWLTKQLGNLKNKNIAKNTRTFLKEVNNGFYMSGL